MLDYVKDNFRNRTNKNIIIPMWHFLSKQTNWIAFYRCLMAKVAWSCSCKKTRGRSVYFSKAALSVEGIIMKIQFGKIHNCCIKRKSKL